MKNESIWRVLWWKDDDIFGTLRVVSHYSNGKIKMIKLDDVSKLQKIISEMKRPIDNERIKKMGATIAELNRKLKEMKK